MTQQDQYDVFISHAVEDKIPVVNELYDLLKAKGLNVWYSGTELNVGDRLTESIHDGLKRCRFGVVVISPTYISKIWALTEFVMLLNKEKDGHKVVLPVLYNITPEELASRATFMAEMFAVRTDQGLDRVADVLFKEIERQQSKQAPRSQTKRTWRVQKKIAMWAAAGLMTTAGIFSAKTAFQSAPVSNSVDTFVTDRIEKVEEKTESELKKIVDVEHAKPAQVKDAQKVFEEFANAKSYFRNEYTLITGVETIRSKKHVGAALGLDLEAISPVNQYTLVAPNIYLCSPSKKELREEKYVFLNSQPISYSLHTLTDNEESKSVKVVYKNYLRLIEVQFRFPPSSKDIKRHQMVITGLKPEELYFFSRKNREWVLDRIE